MRSLSQYIIDRKFSSSTRREFRVCRLPSTGHHAYAIMFLSGDEITQHHVARNKDCTKDPSDAVTDVIANINGLNSRRACHMRVMPRIQRFCAGHLGGYFSTLVEALTTGGIRNAPPVFMQVVLTNSYVSTGVASRGRVTVIPFQ